MTQTRWWTYLRGLMGNDNATEAAKKSDISSSNFTRWKKGARADPDFVVKIARAYNTNVLEALVAAEFITDEEAALTTISPTIDLADIDSTTLIDELQHRVNTIRYLIDLEEGGDEKLARFIEQQSNVVSLQSAQPDTQDGTVVEWNDAANHAAKDGIDENEERIRRGEDPID